jgi:hypothetical protein
VLPIIGWLIFWIRVGGTPWKTALEPVLVGRIGVSPGTADLVTLLMLIAPRYMTLGLGLTLALSALLSYEIHRYARSLPHAAAAMAVYSLFLFPHLTYDYVLLIVPTALLLSEDRPQRLAVFAAIVSLIGLAYLMPSLGKHLSVLLCFWLNFSLLFILGIVVLIPQRRSLSL